MGGAGGAAGVLLGGVLTDALGWRWILFINVPIGITAAVLAQRFIAEGRDRTRSRNFDLSGALTATIGLSLLVLGIVRTAVTGWGSGAFTRSGVKPLLVVGMLAQTAGLLLFIGVSAGGSYLSDVLAGSLLVAIAIGLSFVPATISAVAGVAPHEAGLASGLVNTSRMVGGALGLAILAAIAAARTGADLHHLAASGQAMHVALTDGFTLAFAVA